MGVDRTETHFVKTPVMSTYLVGWAITTYQFSKVYGPNNLKVRFFLFLGLIRVRLFSITRNLPLHSKFFNFCYTSSWVFIEFLSFLSRNQINFLKGSNSQKQKSQNFEKKKLVKINRIIKY